MILIKINSIVENIYKTKQFEDFKTKIGTEYTEFTKEEIESFFLKTSIISDNQIIISNDKKYKILEEIYKSGMEDIKNMFLNEFIKEIPICPYCGKHALIKNTLNQESRLFDIDHFFPKSLYPIASINLYNMIPACKACNFQKRNKNPIAKERNSKVFHPYFGIIKDQKVIETESFDSLFSFSEIEDFGFKNIENLELKDHDNIFKTMYIYLTASDTTQDFKFILDKKEKIKEQIYFRGDILGKNEIIDFFFKHFYPKESKDILKYNNGKFRRDLVLSIRKSLDQ